jgi:hypothetical protein
MQTMHRAYDIYYMRQKIQPNVAFAVILCLLLLEPEGFMLVPIGT